MEVHRGSRLSPEEILREYHQIDEELDRRPVDSSKAVKTGGSFVVYDEDEERDSKNTLDHERQPQFFRPPLQSQRNYFVKETLTRFRREVILQDFNKLAVMGCGELSLERFLVPSLDQLGVTRVVSIDIDEETIAKGMRKMELLMFQKDSFKSHQALPVLLEYFQGNILEYDSRLEGTSCVVSTEVIEHISLKEAEIFMHNVLGKVQPRLFLVSTPNHELNEAFGSPGQFRHADHKYEFNRREFTAWITRILADYPHYRFTIHEVGFLAGFERLGGATQFAAIWTDQPLDSNHPTALPYSKIGHQIAYKGFSLALWTSARLALQQWMGENPLTEDTLIDSNGIHGKCWRIDLEAIKKLIQLPRSVQDKMTGWELMNTVELRTRGRLIAKCSRDDDQDKPHFLLSEDTSIPGLMALIS